MEIRKIETFVGQTNWRNHIFVKVITDEGIHGVGEAYSVGPDNAVLAVIRDFETWLTGRNPWDIERLWALMYNGSRFPIGAVVGAAMSGIEHALWDIKGKALGVPVYELLGGRCRDRVRVYLGAGGDKPDELADNARAAVERYHCSAIKISPQPPQYSQMSENALIHSAGARMEAVRQAVGPDVDIGVDLHARPFEPVRALHLIQALQPYRPFFAEEPIRPENVDALAELRAKTAVPVATGECLYTKFQFRTLLVRHAADIIQPDVCLTGGLLELKKIAAMAESFHVSVAPHNPMGPVATAVNVHFAAATPNFSILEYQPDDRSPRRDWVMEPLTLKDGYLELRTIPGFGVELNEEALVQDVQCWHRPFQFTLDGSVGFW